MKDVCSNSSVQRCRWFWNTHMQKFRKQEDFLCLSLVLNWGFKDVNLGLQESAGKLSSCCEGGNWRQKAFSHILSAQLLGLCECVFHIIQSTSQLYPCSCGHQIVKNSCLTVCLVLSCFSKLTRQIWPARWESSYTQINNLIPFLSFAKWNVHRGNSNPQCAEHSIHKQQLTVEIHCVVKEGDFFSFFIQDIKIFPNAWCSFTLSRLTML